VQQARAAGAAVFGSQCTYKIFPHAPKLVRAPDVSVVRLDRLPASTVPKGHMLIRPDIAAEVVSPNDLAEEIERRVADYLFVGVPLVWVIYPGTRTAYVFRPDGSAQRLSEADDLSGEAVFPGISCQVSLLFQPPVAPANEP
jgi:Uma2 family endonuclease